MNYIIGIFILVCIVVYLFKKRLAWAMNSGVHIIFIVSVVGATASLFVPKVFDFIATSVLSQNGTLETIKNIDDSVSFDKIVEPGTQFFDKVKGLFGQQPTTQEENKGLLEEQIYPSIVSSLSGILRWATLVVSLVFMILSLYLSYLFAGSADTGKLEKKIKELEASVASLSQLSHHHNE